MSAQAAGPEKFQNLARGAGLIWPRRAGPFVLNNKTDASDARAIRKAPWSFSKGAKLNYFYLTKFKNRYNKPVSRQRAVSSSGHGLAGWPFGPPFFWPIIIFIARYHSIERSFPRRRAIRRQPQSAPAAFSGIAFIIYGRQIYKRKNF